MSKDHVVRHQKMLRREAADDPVSLPCRSSNDFIVLIHMIVVAAQ